MLLCQVPPLSFKSLAQQLITDYIKILMVDFQNGNTKVCDLKEGTRCRLHRISDTMCRGQWSSVMARVKTKKKRFIGAPDVFGDEARELELVELVARFVDRTPEEVHEATYDGPEPRVEYTTMELVELELIDS